MSLVGQFEAGDVAMRNLLLVTVGNDETVVQEDLARAFGVVSETVRLIRKAYSVGGLQAVVMRKPGSHGAWKVTPALKAKVFGHFQEGLNQKEVWTKLKGGAGALSKGTLNKLHKEWKATQSVIVEAKADEAPPQAELSFALEAPEPVIAPEPPPASGAIEAKKQESDYAVRVCAPEGGIDGRTLLAPGPVSQRRVQFLGAWLLVALTARLGLHAAVATEGAKGGAEKATRLAVDAVTVALGIGEACVEGVRRLAHRSAAALLLSIRAPSPTWVREVLGAAAAEGKGFFIRAKLSGALIRGAAARAGELAVFYVDNHLRPYSGFRRLLYGWRMQAKRPVRGTTDCHVHDADGRPLYRVATMAHDSLGKLLLPIAVLLRLALGENQRILLAFDRAASYAEVMAELRDAAFEFVAYEKKPYRLLPKRLFRKRLTLDGQRLRWYEMGANLADGGSRLRRICIRLPDGHQLNLLANSTATVPALITIMAGRWNQENAFKHSVERWGLNQLDGRTFASFDADALITNPARRRLDASITILREVEGKLHRNLLRATRPELRAELEQELARNLHNQRLLEEQRPGFPIHCTVREAGLHGELMCHEDEYKAVIDTIRTACVNAEANLASELATFMARPRQAKRLLQNFFSAPGDLRVTTNHIEIVLDAAATPEERFALDGLCATVNAWRLTHPGDAAARPLRFRTQVS
jgi:hypothetical protein